MTTATTNINLKLDSMRVVATAIAAALNADPQIYRYPGGSWELDTENACDNSAMIRTGHGDEWLEVKLTRFRDKGETRVRATGFLSHALFRWEPRFPSREKAEQHGHPWARLDGEETVGTVASERGFDALLRTVTTRVASRMAEVFVGVSERRRAAIAETKMTEARMQELLGLVQGFGTHERGPIGRGFELEEVALGKHDHFAKNYTAPSFNFSGPDRVTITLPSMGYGEAYKIVELWAALHGKAPSGDAPTLAK